MNNDSSASIVSKVWNYAHVLKNAGVGYGDYVEQITYLQFDSDLRSPGFAQTCGLPISASLRLKLAKQPQIVAEVEARTTAIDHREAELNRQITRSSRLRQSTLKSAFNRSLTGTLS